MEHLNSCHGNKCQGIERQGEMVEHGAALALCGNHELDALQYATPDGRGGWLRPHIERNLAMHARTQAEFAGRPDEWREWLCWFQTLPLRRVLVVVERGRR